MTGKTKKISFLVDKSEFKLIEESCLFGASAECNLKRAVKEAGKYRIEFSFQELDDLVGYIAHCGGHEESEYKQRKWDKLYDKIECLLIPPEISKEAELLNSLLPIVATGLRYYVFDVWIESGRARPMEEKVLRKLLAFSLITALVFTTTLKNTTVQRKHTSSFQISGKSLYAQRRRESRGRRYTRHSRLSDRRCCSSLTTGMDGALSWS